jgi:hypothetical protein
MLKIVGLTILAVILEISGIAVLYFYFVSLTTGGNIPFLIGSILLLGGGVYLFIVAGKSDRTVVSAMPPIKPLEEIGESAEERIKKNNAMMGDWVKTNETKDRLRMLELQANAENGK